MKYDLTSRILHWLSAIVILWATITGFYTLIPSVEDSTKLAIASFNVSLTTVFIPVFIFRVLYRLSIRGPSAPIDTSTLEKKIATVMHIFLYLLVVVVLATGVLMMNTPIVVFNLFTLDQVINDSTWVELFKVIHRYSTELLAVCILIHIAALLKHELSGKKILRRMM